MSAPNHKQNYNIRTHKGERVYTIPGKNGPNDMKIFSEFPRQPWAHSLFYVGLILRLKAEVEDRNYPPPNQGAGYLWRFIKDCMFKRYIPIGELCKQYKIEFSEIGFADTSAIEKLPEEKQSQQELFTKGGNFLPRNPGNYDA